MKKLESLKKKAVNQLVSSARYGWPPDCVGYFYQPTRPVEKEAVILDTASDVTPLPQNSNK